MLSFTAQEIYDAKLNKAIIDKVWLQVKKDFQLYDEKIELEETHETAYDALFHQIQPILDRMLNLDSARFFSLLYAIDVAESEVKKLLFGEPALNVGSEITHMILERELFKVLSRIYYAQQMNM